MRRLPAMRRLLGADRCGTGVGRSGRRLAWLPALLGLAALQSGLDCSPKILVSVTPTSGTTITTFSFPIEIQLGPGADPSTLSLELNGVDVTARLSGGPTSFTASIQPGSPLRDHNQLVVRVEQADSYGIKVRFPVSFDYLPPKARAFEVSDQSQCITGPLAHCTPGDFMMANDQARFVVQKANQRELHFVGTFGGNLIDAEVVENGVPQGRDNFFEVQPAVNIETVIDATSAEIVNDGQDGTTAIVRTCGPDDLLDDINPSSAVRGVGNYPPSADDRDDDVTGCTEYRLDPQTRTVEMVTTIENLESQALPLYVGDYVNGGGELEQWTPVSPVAPVSIGQAGLGEMLANWGVEALAYFGFDEAEGVSYALVAPQQPLVPAPSSTFTQTGVSFMLHGNSIPLVLAFAAPSNFSVPAGGTNSFRRWFTVGTGNGADAVTAFADANGLPTGTLRGCVRDGAGDPVPGARVAAGRDTSGGTSALQVLKSHWVAGSDGCYEGRIPSGAYLVAAAKQGYPYEGGSATAPTHLVTVPTGGTVVQDVVLPVTGHLHVDVVDSGQSPVPARVGVVGFDPSPEPTFFATVLSGNDTRTSLFYDLSGDAVPTALSRTEYTDASGHLDIDLEPGNYEIAISRGGEWSLYTQQVTVGAGNVSSVSAQIARVLDTTGWISSDFHVHMIDSPDSRISRLSRIKSFAGEGVDNIIATDHAYVTDLTGDIAAAGFTSFVHSTPGEEITTFDYGHFNAYPQGVEPFAQRPQTRGSTDHSGAAPPGQDFPAYGHYNLTPAEIDAAVHADPYNAGLDTVVQVNHIDSHFDPLKIDTSQTPPRSVLAAGEPAIFRLDPGVSNFFHRFVALELWNGASAAKEVEFLNLRMGIWMNLLNQGLATTFIADTDTHEVHNLNTAGARTWTPSSTDVVSGIVDTEIPHAVLAGKAVGGQGVFVTARLLATDGSGGVAHLDGLVPASTPPASTAAGTLVSVTNGAVDLEIHAQAPTWAPYDRIEIYRNASTQVTRRNGGVATLFTGLPTQTLQAGTDFTVQTVPVNGAARLQTDLTVSLTGLTRDEWIVVAVRGTQGVSPPMFPVYPQPTNVATENPTLADLENVTPGETGVRALGVTNALYVDVDGNGVFDPPGVSVVP
jgi:hypothetical protein